MKKLAPTLALLALTAAACADPDVQQECKAEFLIAADDVLDVTIDGDVASIDCPFTCPLPDGVADDDIESALDGPSALMITNANGTTVDLMQAMAPQTSDPSAAGEWSYEITRDANGGTVTLKTFTTFNDGTRDRVLVPGDYTAAVALGDNAVFEALTDITVTLNVQ